jgi:3-dehydroquinate synthase
MFQKIEISTGQSLSQIYFGFDWHRVTELLPSDTKVVIVTDNNLKLIYGDEFPDYPVLSVNPGETSKNLATISRLTEQLLKLGVDRKGFILGIGGGVVCDLAGFLASVYMRGIRFGFISTSLLSQVDASIGGKNGVNSRSAKNIIGLFNQPEFVICDISMLATLPEDEYLSGLTELLKAALIRDKQLVDKIDANYRSVLSRDSDLLNDLIIQSVQIKKRVVQEDERESGERKILNFGHTFGHAAESEYLIKHGIAVAWGMVAAMELANRNGYLHDADRKYVTQIIHKLGLLQGADIRGRDVAKKISSDKKRSGDSIDFVFLTGPGKCMLEKVSITDLVKFIRTFN